MRHLIALAASILLVAPAALPAAAGETVVKITAKNWAFTPSTITLKLNQKVKLEFQATEGLHGISIPELGVNDVINIGATRTDVEVTPTKLGTFQAHCAVFCGAGHANMVLTIKVVK